MQVPTESIFNLSYLSRIIERVVAQRFNTHISNSHLLPVLQSAYRSFHSIETAVLSVHNDLVIDNGRVSLLVLLELELVLAFISSRLDYHNSVLACLQQVTLKPLQRVQNAAVRLILDRILWNHTTPVVNTLAYPVQVVFYHTVHSCWKMPSPHDGVCNTVAEHSFWAAFSKFVFIRHTMATSEIWGTGIFLCR